MYALSDRTEAHARSGVTVPRLTTRQLECLAWVQEGKSAHDIGKILGISGRTVDGHLAAACEALGVRRRIQAVIKARGLGLLGDAGA